MPTLTRSEPLYDQIYEILWDKILASEIRPGTRLRDVEWAEKLDVSRTPVREALRKMQKDGILEPVGHGRYVLKRMAAEELGSLYRCRAVLEALSLRELKEPLAASDLTALRALVADTEAALKAEDAEGVFQNNTEFHDRILAQSNNAYLISLITNIRRIILFARASLRDLIQDDANLKAAYFSHLENGQIYHTEILEALAAADFEKAGARMERHLFETAEHMQAILAKTKR